jgi:hypothetical protein
VPKRGQPTATTLHNISEERRSDVQYIVAQIEITHKRALVKESQAYLDQWETRLWEDIDCVAEERFAAVCPSHRNFRLAGHAVYMKKKINSYRVLVLKPGSDMGGRIILKRN